MNISVPYTCTNSQGCTVDLLTSISRPPGGIGYADRPHMASARHVLQAVGNQGQSFKVSQGFHRHIPVTLLSSTETDSVGALTVYLEAFIDPKAQPLATININNRCPLQ